MCPLQELEAAIQEYVNLHLYQNYQTSEVLESLLLKYHALPEFLGLNEDQGMATALAELDKDDLLNEFAETDAIELNPEQQAVHDALAHRTSGISMVSGMGGTGKTLLMKKLTRTLRLAGKTVRLCATTGAAAIRLSKRGVTAHSLFALPAGSSILCGLSPTNPTYEKLVSTNVFIIDEMSMLTAGLFGCILHRLLQVVMCDGHDVPLSTIDLDQLKDKHIVLNGDHGQVRTTPKIQCHPCLLLLYACFVQSGVGQSVRQ